VNEFRNSVTASLLTKSSSKSLLLQYTIKNKSDRVDFFARCLQLSSKRNYSNDILNIYLYFLGKFQKEYNTRIHSIKEQSGSENEYGPFFKAVEIFKELFEEKIPIKVYAKLKQQCEKCCRMMPLPHP
jgi:hypothetical protein